MDEQFEDRIEDATGFVRNAVRNASPEWSISESANAIAIALIEIAKELHELNARVGYITETKHIHWVNPEP